nr:AT3g28270/MZF16_5 [Arabidopsis thaliana]
MALSKDLMLKCSEDMMSAYKSAYEEHPKLKSFDASLQQRTNKMIDSLTVEDKNGSSSPHDAHMELSKHLVEVTQGVADFITEIEDDVWDNQALKYLVLAYFENTKKTLEIFKTIENCVENAEMGQLLIREALAEFEKESAEKDVGGKKKKYEKTLEDLKSFKEMGDPFDGKVLTTQFERIKKQQESLLEEVSETRKKIQDEISNLEKKTLITNVVFGAAFAIVAVASIALIATGVGAAAGFGALAAPLLAAGWAGVYTTLDKKKDALNKQLEGLKKVEEIEESVEKGIKTNEEATETVSILVDGLEDRIKNMLKLVDNAIDHEDNEAATRIVLTQISKKVEKLTKKITEVGESVEDHSKLIAKARLQVLQKINR